jgi:hypothetical protein
MYEMGPLLFVGLEEIIYHNQPMLYYCITIDMLEVLDWHDPSDSSSLGGDFNPDSLVGWLKPWPKQARFSGRGGGGGGHPKCTQH